MSGRPFRLDRSPLGQEQVLWRGQLAPLWLSLDCGSFAKLLEYIGELREVFDDLGEEVQEPCGALEAHFWAPFLRSRLGCLLAKPGPPRGLQEALLLPAEFQWGGSQRQGEDIFH